MLESAIAHFRRDFVTATSKANILVSEVYVSPSVRSVVGLVEWRLHITECWMSLITVFSL